MSVIVTDAGFGPNTFDGDFVAPETLPANDCCVGLDLASDAEPADLVGKLEHVTLIRVDFPSFADGRGFTIARDLRRAGFTGRLRARGHVIADQYAMARRSGFDEVEISAALAARQPEPQWVFRAETWEQNDYQSRLRGTM